MCPDFVGPGRLVGQLRAVVLRSWDTPLAKAFSPALRTTRCNRPDGIMALTFPTGTFE